MDLTSFRMQTIVHQFDTVCKQALRGEKVDYYRSIDAHTTHETLFCELDEQQIEALGNADQYPSDKTIFRVHDYEVGIENTLLADALAMLPKQHRDIVLLSYMLGMNDTEIAKLLNIVRRTVQYQRTSSLEILRDHMEDWK